MKILWKRGEILFSTIFYNLILDFCVIIRTRFFLRDKRLFEITEVEITRVDCIYFIFYNIYGTYLFVDMSIKYRLSIDILISIIDLFLFVIKLFNYFDNFECLVVDRLQSRPQILFILSVRYAD